MKKRYSSGLCILLIVSMTLLMLPMTGWAASDNNSKKMEAVTLNGTDFPDYDYSQANQLPLTGYFNYNFSISGIERTAKIYISEDAPIRSYFTVIAVPGGMDTEEFLDVTGWKEIADQKAEGLFILEPGADGWGTYSEEAAYISAALGFYSGNRYFSIYGEHYFVGYGDGAPALEAWAAANPLRVISQVYLDSEGLDEAYLTQFEEMEFGGINGGYNPILFPEDFDYIAVSEALLPTWYINPVKGQFDDSLDYWLNANDCDAVPEMDKVFGMVYPQSNDSESWMTSYSGPISKVAVLNKKVNVLKKSVTKDICDFMNFYTRYENVIAYGNQLVERADYKALGIEVKTMIVEGELREYMVYVPDSAKKMWGDKAPVVMVWPGNTQTDKVFLDATQWWKVAQEEGFVLAIICEQYVANSVTVSHKNSITFYEQLKEVLLDDYKVDPARIYSTGQSAGSMVSQSFAAVFPDFFAAVASTSGDARIGADGKITIDTVPYDVSTQMIPNYLIYGTGDLSFLKGHLWDELDNNLDAVAAHHLAVNDFSLDEHNYDSASISGWMDRFKTWTWSKEFSGEEVPIFQVTENIYRSHNCIHEEMPVLWDFLEHYSMTMDQDGNVVRFYSPSGFTVPNDQIQIYSSQE
ncbi:PHB depolymerase family esterase [Acidaminobacter hydrogenoformans]|uniref:Esterase PHB depolymerase n=1 Tax=Acidaminobacter hydrogenoformans DSM 2784 TaxID=1120920 RepID=A0A1G5S1Q2_9FIRM|nr:PHB depolymerase family esterase [Acidaminobacter hydrogenoformans]SCZ80226.1 Esterase PHB depolymerase [Acidaminobacter hydrogenoformans DSM 2784]